MEQASDKAGWNRARERVNQVHKGNGFSSSSHSQILAAFPDLIRWHANSPANSLAQVQVDHPALQRLTTGKGEDPHNSLPQKRWGNHFGFAASVGGSI